MVPYIKATTLRTHYEDLQNIFDFLYPVGTVYWTSRDENPEDTFGFGKWEQIKDKFVWAKGDIEEENMPTGEMTHTLNRSEMPSHAHTTNVYHRHHSSNRTNYTSEDGWGNYYGTVEQVAIRDGNTGNPSGAFSYSYHTSANDEGGSSSFGYITLNMNSNHYHNFGAWSNEYIYNHDLGAIGSYGSWNVGSTNNGSDAAHNNMPPYTIRYCWERVG